MKRSFYIIAALFAFLLTSCKDEVELIDVDFSSLMEQPNGEDSSKTYLAMERYIHWESTDKVMVFSGDDGPWTDDWTQRREVSVVPSSDKRFGSISLPGFQYADNYYGIYPSISAVSDNPKQIVFPSSYDYSGVSVESGVTGTNYLSYPKPGFPMVAYHNSTDRWYHDTDNENLPAFDFHSLVGLVRLQFSLSSAASFNLSKIVISNYDNNAKIAGKFNIYDIGLDSHGDYIDHNEPYVSFRDNETSITLNMGKITVAPGKLITIYVPLPATENARTNTQDYKLQLDFYDYESNTIKYRKGVDAKIRRNQISFFPVLYLDKISTDADYTGIVGCGTQQRPFQIYTPDDMIKVRNAFNNGTTINGQTVTNDTYFRVVRSDIVLGSSWNEGIRNFKGHFTYSAGHATNAGITNNGSAPIFESIDAGAVVEGINVKGSATANTNPFSPLCHTNNGTISDCHFLGSLSSGSRNLAGICAVNGTTGRLVNCSNRGTITATATGSSAAGICYTNNGTISAFTITSSDVKAQNSAAGICYTNTGTVENSQVNLSYGSQSTPITYGFGGLVYTNETTGIIRNCEVLGSLFSTQEFGGICHTNKNLVDACRVGITFVRGATVNESQYVGGVAARQTGNNAAEIRNCFNSSAQSANLQAGVGYCGGIVGFISSGYVRNCFTNLEVAYTNLNHYGMIAGYIATPSGNTIQNCYNGRDVAPFYAEATIPQVQISTNCFNPDSYQPYQAYCSRYTIRTGSVTYLAGSTDDLSEKTLSGELNSWVDDNDPSKYLRWSLDAAPRFVASSSKNRTKK